LLGPIRKPARRKALLAIAFAGGMLNSQLPALSENKSDSTDSVVQQIANSTQLTTEVRAFFLLRLASRYIAGENRTALEAEFRPVVNEPKKSVLFRKSSMENILVSWAEEVSSDRRLTNQGDTRPDSQSIVDKNSVLAGAAIQQALIQLDKASDKFAKLNMYFIASRLFQKMGKTDGMRKCSAVVQEAFQACEGNSQIDEDQIEAASSVLNSMAYGLIPVHIKDMTLNDRPWLPQSQVKPFTEKDFKESEKLKLRAIAMVDRLGAADHVRRKAHRDLALWYLQLGKMEMAEKEKQTLFELVGSKNDSFLYPEAIGCGQYVWWQKVEIMMGCGMG
jgi:hypothetical protein